MKKREIFCDLLTPLMNGSEALTKFFEQETEEK